MSRGRPMPSAWEARRISISRTGHVNTTMSRFVSPGRRIGDLNPVLWTSFSPHQQDHGSESLGSRKVRRPVACASSGTVGRDVAPQARAKSMAGASCSCCPGHRSQGSSPTLLPIRCAFALPGGRRSTGNSCHRLPAKTGAAQEIDFLLTRPVGRPPMRRRPRSSNYVPAWKLLFPAIAAWSMPLTLTSFARWCRVGACTCDSPAIQGHYALKVTPFAHLVENGPAFLHA